MHNNHIAELSELPSSLVLVDVSNNPISSLIVCTCDDAT